LSSVSTRRPGELVFVVLLVIFSMLAAWQAWSISGFASPSSPGMFPMFAAATMVISGLVILVDTARRRREAGEGGFLAEVTPVRLIVFAAMIIGYMAALQPVGFIGSSFAFLFASMAYLNRGSILLNLVVSAASLAVIYVIFRHVFSVVLPAGTLF
jgi:putative tricarboxylic transport membrane protein